MNTWQSGFSSGGIHYYRSGGDKTPLLLAHGYTDHSLCWTRTAQVLEADYDLIMPDARGHGQSPNPAEAYTSELHAADIAALIQELGLEQPPVVGHSMGAMNAMFIAANHGDTVGAVVLVDPPWRNDEQLRTAEFWQEWRNRIADDKTLSDADLVARIQRDNPHWHVLEAEAKAEAIRQFDIHTFDLYSLTKRPWQEVLPEVQCPALLLYADAGIVTAEVAAQAEALAPRLVAQGIADCGHSIQRDHFEDFITAVQDYLRQQALN